MEKNDLRESKKEIPVYRVSSKATRLFFKVIKATSIKLGFISLVMFSYMGVRICIFCNEIVFSVTKFYFL